MRLKNKWKLYEYINKIPRISTLSLKFMLGWSSKKLKRGLKQLEKDGLIKKNPNKENRYYPTSVKELINWEEMNSKPEDYKDG